MLAQYLPGLAFLTLASVIVALPFAVFIKSKLLAVLLSVGASTLILKTWAWFSMGGFDAAFLLILLAVGLVTAISVKVATDSIRPLVGRVRAQ
jgi:hypothetical protein